MPVAVDVPVALVVVAAAASETPDELQIHPIYNNNTYSIKSVRSSDSEQAITAKHANRLPMPLYDSHLHDVAILTWCHPARWLCPVTGSDGSMSFNLSGRPAANDRTLG